MHWPPLKSFFLIVLISCLLMGCTPEKESSDPQVVYAGMGVSNRLEVGMTLKKIGQRNDDVKLTRYWKPDTRPWEKILSKPQQFEAFVPSLGASVWGFDEGQAFGELSFDCQKLPPIFLRAGTNEIALSAQQPLSFDEIVRRFGRPVFVVNEPPLQRVPQFINAGQSVIWSNQHWVSLYFPAEGIFFHCRGNNLERFSIVRKFTDTNAAANRL